MPEPKILYPWITSHWNWSNHFGPGRDEKAEEAERRWEKRKNEKWEERRRRESTVPPPHGTLDACKPLLSWATLSGFLFCEMKRSLTRMACFGPYAGLVAGAQRTVDESCQEAQVPAGAGSSGLILLLHSKVLLLCEPDIFLCQRWAPWLSPKQLTQKQGVAPCLEGTRNKWSPAKNAF